MKTMVIILKRDYRRVHFILLLLLLLVAAFNTFNIIQIYDLKKPVIEIKPLERDITLTIITPANCDECTDLIQMADYVEQLGVVFSSKEVLSQYEGESLINKHGIKRLPAIIIKGHSPTLDQMFNRTETGYLFDEPYPPYADIDGKIYGVVSAVIINDSCSECSGVRNVLLSMQTVYKVYISSETAIDSSSEDGQRLLEHYNITKVPTIILSEDALEYEVIEQSWLDIGTIETDGKLVLREVLPPYHDLIDNEVKGLTNAIYLTDSSCTDCFDVTTLKPILTENFGIALTNEVTYDTSSDNGKRLIQSYSITTVPTIILSQDAQYYKAIEVGWESLGTIENDGMYVLRNLNVFPQITYKNVITGELNSTF
ncbi:hypothetical protein ACFLZN_01260 [Nanoarchaeota archaeon]